MSEPHPHAAIIDSFGGPTEVAKLLGTGEEPTSVQRVSNWKRRGIPSEVLLEHEFLRAAVRAAARAQAQAAQPEAA